MDKGGDNEEDNYDADYDNDNGDGEDDHDPCIIAVVFASAGCSWRLHLTIYYVSQNITLGSTLNK